MPRLRHDARALSFSSEMASGIGRGVLTGIRTGIRTGMRTSVRMLATVGGLLALALPARAYVRWFLRMWQP